VKRFLSLTCVLVLFLLSAIPAQAAVGDAKVTIYDVTAGATVCVATTSSACNGMAFVANHFYSFTVQEISNTASANLLISPTFTHGNDFSDHTWAYGYIGTPNPCTVTDNASSWQVSCVATTNRVLYATLQGKAKSTADRSGQGRVKLLPNATKLANFSYTTP
jgi:hypothetical protein